MNVYESIIFTRMEPLLRVNSSDPALDTNGFYGFCPSVSFLFRKFCRVQTNLSFGATLPKMASIDGDSKFSYNMTE